MATTCLAIAFAAVAAVPVAAVPVSASAVKTPDVKACFDGKCKITITTAVKFRVSGQLGFTWLSIARVDSSAVKVQGTGPGVSSATTLGVGGSGSVGKLSVKVSSITDASATVHLAPR
ncbi:hypothetical protein AB0F17_52675 [Nonomuraea sp. NPDC026600]|uniref:hypothetical protein n=1 Tax=Nonomuraea sp. NPDC026600 TaxID=3155363 RepID=UPI0033CD9E0A